MSWASDLARIAKRASVKTEELARAVKIELFSGVVTDTRVDTGRLRGNWQIQENSKPDGEIDRIDSTGATVLAEIEQKSTTVGLTYFVNNLPYAAVWEERDAMVARNVSRVRQIVRARAKS